MPTKSIFYNKEQCYFCGVKTGLCTHHVYFGNANRNISEKHGFKVRLCAFHHNLGGNGECVHRCREMDLELKRACQEAYEEDHSREEFIKLIGKSYLD